tara:strand:- start:1333 stop:1620 length:288 start_codon:yes stop_codon:yes gene_type:complete
VAIINPPAQDRDNLLQEVVGRISELLPVFPMFAAQAEQKEALQPTEEKEDLLPQTATEEPIDSSNPVRERLQAARQALSNQRKQRTQVPEEIRHA